MKQKGIPKREIIYRTNFILRLIQFFFYYWILAAGLLFLPLLIIGIYQSVSELWQEWQGGPEAEDAWWMLAAGIAMVCWISYAFLKAVRNFRKPVKDISGIVTDKFCVSDEGDTFYIRLGGENSQGIEIGRRSYEKIRIGNRLEIKWSNQLQQATRILRIHS